MSRLMLLLIAAITFAAVGCLGESAELQVLDTQAETATGLMRGRARGRGRGRAVRTSGTFLVMTNGNGLTNRAGNDEEELGEANDPNTPKSDPCTNSVSDACANGRCSFFTLNAHIGRCLPKCASLFAAKSTSTEHSELPKGSTLEAWLRKDADLAQRIKKNRGDLAKKTNEFQEVEERLGSSVADLRDGVKSLGKAQRASGGTQAALATEVSKVRMASGQLVAPQRALTLATDALRKSITRLPSSSRSLQHKVETQTSQSWGSRRRRTGSSSGAKEAMGQSISAIGRANTQLGKATGVLDSSVRRLETERHNLKNAAKDTADAFKGLVKTAAATIDNQRKLQKTAGAQASILENSGFLEASQERLLNVEFEHAGARWNCTALDLAPRRGYVCHQKGLDSAAVICKGLMLPSQGCTDPNNKCMIDRPLVKQVACVKDKCDVDKLSICHGSKEACQSETALQDVKSLTLHF